MSNMLVANAKVMANGQITIPKNVLDALGVTTGNHVTFVVEGESVRMVNSAIYAMRAFQEEMEGEGERVGLFSDDDVIALVEDMRRDDARDC